jgi:predicted pyridoxine 5'-phosphate oxidase superfamily flavin-nucleotide-binding protein
MAMTLNDDMKRMVEQERLGFIATVCPDGSPNLSPKGSLIVWDDQHLAFADIHSPGTVANLALNPAIEVNVVDPFVRKGYRFKGSAHVLEEGRSFDDGVQRYRNRGVHYPIHHIVLIRVDVAMPVTSPVYDTAVSEDEVRRKWEDHHRESRPRAQPAESANPVP